MNRRALIFWTIFGSIALGIALSVTYLARTPLTPLTGADQLVLVVADTDTSTHARLETFYRQGNTWRPMFTCPAILGRNGLAWGRGLHRDRDRTPLEPVKREGDGKSPAGAFELLHAFGYPPPDSVQTKLPYTQSTPDLICLDDIRSEYYALVVNLREKKLDPANLPSHENMRRDDDLYRYVIVVGHNTDRPVKGAGSCVFLHIWRGENSFTAGCTAMAVENMQRLLAWLDPQKRPVLVQLTGKSYERLKGDWGLPGR
ncbi:MAG: L,D-transpeptidase family protein [Candidatus Latescibacter sp.]|nr:L,D-transpeptidase family protein [Candidatus Latescibacter sp.]